jgi:hypothetical protein
MNPLHDQSITAISKNYRRSINAQIIICAHRRHVVAVGRCWPGNRNDVIVARATVAHLLDAINHSLQAISGLWNLKTPRPLLVNS